MTTYTLKPTSSANIQRAFDVVGTGKRYDEVHFLSGKYPVNSRMYLNSETTITCDPGVILQAQSINFGVNVPVIGQRGNSITDLDISGLCFEGFYQNQPKTPNDHGLGYENFLQFDNCTNSVFHGLSGGNNEGDFIRIQRGSNLEFYDNIGVGSGHDYLHLYNVEGVKIHDNEASVRTGNFLRLRTCRHVDFHDNKCHGVRTAYSSPIQLEHIINGQSYDITIRDNLIENGLGPGIWFICDHSGASQVKITGNTIRNCGQMPAANHLGGVGGIILGGWDVVTIDSNIIDGNQGYGIGLTDFAGKSTGSNFEVIVTNNKITNTKPANYKWRASGAGFANLNKQYKITMGGNTFSGNASENYGI